MISGQVRFYAVLPDHRGSKQATRRYRAFNREYVQERIACGDTMECVAMFPDEMRREGMQLCMVREGLTVMADAELNKRALRINMHQVKLLDPEVVRKVEEFKRHLLSIS